MSDDLKTGRTTPPSDDEWSLIWRNLDRVRRMWPVVVPIVAVCENWKALITVAAIVTFIRGPELLSFIANLIESTK